MELDATLDINIDFDGYVQIGPKGCELAMRAAVAESSPSLASQASSSSAALVQAEAVDTVPEAAKRKAEKVNPGNHSNLHMPADPLDSEVCRSAKMKKKAAKQMARVK